MLCAFCGNKALCETSTNNNYSRDNKDFKLKYIEEVSEPLSN